MKISFQIIENYYGQAIPSIVLQVEKETYIFNVPETFQRHKSEYQIKLPKQVIIFLTQLSTESFSGLYPLISTLQQSETQIKLYGPAGNTDFLYFTKYLMGINMMNTSSYDFLHKEIDMKYQMKQFKSFAKKEDTLNFVQLENFVELVNYQFQNYIESLDKSKINDSSSKINLKGQFQDQNVKITAINCVTKYKSLEGFILAKDFSQHISYICHISKSFAKVNKDKLDEYGIKGKDINTLMKEGEFKLPNGQIIYAAECKLKEEAAPIFIIVDCPNLEVLQQLKSDKKLQKLYQNNINSENKTIRAIMHICPLDILQSEEYQQWIKNFNQSTLKNLICQSHFKEFQIFNKLQYQYKNFYSMDFMNKVMPLQFPKVSLQPYTKTPSLENSLIDYTVNHLYQDFHLKNKTSHLGFTQYNKDLLVKLQKWESSYKEYEKNIFKKSQKLILNQQIGSNNLYENDPEIIFLGTGSMLPNSLRNVASILIKNQKPNIIGGNILLDCGEATYSQLLNHYSINLIEEVLININIIFISHIHGDHIFGLFQLVKERQKILEKKNLKFEDYPLYCVFAYNMAI